MSLGVGAVERNRPSRQCLGRALHFPHIAGEKYRSRIGQHRDEPLVASGKVWIEIDGALEELLRDGVILDGELAYVPPSALAGGPGVEVSWRLARCALPLGIGNHRGDGGGYRLGDLIL